MFQALLEDDVGRDERAGNPAGGQPRPASRGRIPMKSIPGEAAGTRRRERQMPENQRVRGDRGRRRGGGRVRAAPPGLSSPLLQHPEHVVQAHIDRYQASQEVVHQIRSLGRHRLGIHRATAEFEADLERLFHDLAHQPLMI